METILVVIIVFAAVAYLAKKTYSKARLSRPKSCDKDCQDGCGNCGC